MGKITVKHYLNKQLKPEIDGNEILFPIYVSISVNRKFIRKRSGIYESVTVKDLENNFVNLPDIKRKLTYEKDLITRIVKIFIHDYEGKKTKTYLVSFFDMKGYNSKDDFINILNAYIDYYSHSIFEAISNFCNSEIENEVFTKLAQVFMLPNQAEAKKIFSYQSPLKEAEFIHNNLSRESVEFLILRERLRSFLAPYSLKTGYDIPLIDWVDNLIQNDFRNFLQTYKRDSDYYMKKDFVFSKELIDRYISIIDGIVFSSNYFEIAKSKRKIQI